MKPFPQSWLLRGRVVQPDGRAAECTLPIEQGIIAAVTTDQAAEAGGSLALPYRKSVEMNRTLLLIAVTFAGAMLSQLSVLPQWAAADPPVAAVTPQHQQGQELFKQWQTYARTDGKIPGAMIGKLRDEVEYFISLNKEDSRAGHDMSVKFEQLLPRFDAGVDWAPTDAIKLLDDVCAVHTIPLDNALGAAAERVILTGQPLPEELQDVSWGPSSPEGLRVAWHLEPSAKWYPIGTCLRSRILVHNAGDETVFFIMPSWQQSAAHTATDAQGVKHQVTSTMWTTRAQQLTYRLPPGAYCETPAAGIGVGAKTADDWANVRVGSWIGAKQGDEVRFSPAAIEVRCSPSVIGTRIMKGRHTNVDPKDAADLWQRIIAQRVQRQLPLPQAATERTHILRRLTRELFDEEPTQEEIATFVSDDSPQAQTALEKRLLERPGVVPFTGALAPGEIRFRVHGVDPDAANNPRIATGPGYYTLGKNQRLQVQRSRQGERRVNQATLRFFSSDRSIQPPPPYEIALPDGLLTYGIAWDDESGLLWVVQTDLIRSYDFSAPADVKETRFQQAEQGKVPARVREAVDDAFEMIGKPMRAEVVR